MLSGETLYGTAATGGPQAKGTLFSLDTNGNNFTVLHAFSTNSDNGVGPRSELLLDGDTLYGTTSGWGSTSCGTVFSVKTNGADYAVLWVLTNDELGHQRTGVGQQRAVWHDRRRQQSQQWHGVPVNTDGTGYRILHEFSAPVPSEYGSNWDGAIPSASLCLVSNTLYGTRKGGVKRKGTLFSLKTDGSGFTVLHAFSTNKWDGAYPKLPLFARATRSTAQRNGTNQAIWEGAGTVFRLDLAPAVKDNNNPTLAITSPKPGVQTTSKLFTVSARPKTMWR